MQAVILAGGLGTRLRPLVDDRNKTMAPVAGRPFLEYLLMRLRRYGVADVVLCVGHGAELIRGYFGTGDGWQMRLRYSREEELRGTGGAIKMAQELIDGESFLVMNGDSVFAVDLYRLADYHRRRNALVTVGLAQVADTRRFGTVETDQTGRVVGFVEKGQGSPSGLINGGIYVFDRGVLDLIPEGRAVSLEHEIFPTLVGREFYGLAFGADFVDMGVPEDYLRLAADPGRLTGSLA